MEQEVKNIIRIFNEAWLNAEWEVIEALLHEHVVFSSLDHLEGKEIKGRDRAMQSIKRFIYQSSVHHFEINSETITTWGNTAKAQIQYTLNYEMSHKRFKEQCSETWILTHQNKGWKILWRLLMNRVLML